MTDWMKRALSDLKRGRNADAYVAVAAAFSLGLLGLLNILDLRWTASVLILCLIPVINLLLELRDRTSGGGRDQLTPESAWPASLLADDWRRGSDVLLIGVTLIRTIRNAESDIARCLSAGRHVRVLVCDPRSEVAMRLTDTRRKYGPADADGNAQEVALTLATLQRIRETVPDAQLELRTIDYPIGTGTIGFALDKTNARLYVSTYPFRTEETQPHFVVEPRHGHWFDHFKEEAESMWRAGVAWSDKTDPLTDRPR